MGDKKPPYLRTSDVAKAVGVHPNTVRLYEEWGLLPPIPRTPGGYRRFTQAHVNQMRLARTAMHTTWLGGEIRKLALDMVKGAASGGLGGALELAYELRTTIRLEQARAEGAAELLQRWARGQATDSTVGPLHIGETAGLLSVTRDTLRNWERNGLIEVPRDPGNGYRLYGAAEIGRLRVIRMLRQAKYSTMAILRMLRQLDRGRREGLRQALDTPGPEEDVYYATDRWLSTLAELQEKMNQAIALLEEMIQKQQE